jgi:hypothetical protein
MAEPKSLHSALDELMAGEVALEKLDRLCCEPGRSPRMRALAATLERAQETIAADPQVALSYLEDAGAQVGHLQVGCCTEARMPLYSSLLESLARAQLAINRDVGHGH